MHPALALRSKISHGNDLPYTPHLCCWQTFLWGGKVGVGGWEGGNSCRVGPGGRGFFPAKEVMLLLKGDACLSLPAFPKTGMS